jgi:hypothetical protein
MLLSNKGCAIVQVPVEEKSPVSKSAMKKSSARAMLKLLKKPILTKINILLMAECLLMEFLIKE